MLFLKTSMGLVARRGLGVAMESSRPASRVGSETIESVSPWPSMEVRMDCIGGLLMRGFWNGSGGGGGGGGPLYSLDPMFFLLASSDKSSFELIPSEMVGGGLDPESSGVELVLSTALLDAVLGLLLCPPEPDLL